MKIKTVFWIYFIITLPSTNIKAQDSLFIFTFPARDKFDISVKATVIKQEDKFFYSYRINSALTSEQDIATYKVWYDGEIKNPISPQNWRVRNNIRKRRISWWSKDSLSDIYPGGSLNGFSYESEGLPSIQLFLSRAFVEIPPLEREPDSTVNSSIFDTSKKGKTIAPKAPPDPFFPIVFLDTLISYKHQAFELGWIDNQGIANSLDAKLDNAKKQLEKGKTKTAINVLQAFVNEVEAQKDKHLTSEAYALLKYNAEYLIKKLSEE